MVNREHIFRSIHPLEPGKCKQRVLQSFYWPGVFADVTRHCRSCDICQRTSKRDNVKVPTVKTPIIREPFSKIVIDIVVPFKSN